jgi:hypothetical protein
MSSQLGQRQGAMAEILSGAPTDVSNLASDMRRRYRQEGIPDINAGFANVGGIMNTRRGTTIQRGVNDLESQIGALQTRLIESARTRQLGAAGQVLQSVMQPLQIGAGFSTARTTDTLATPTGLSQGMGMGMDALGTGAGLWAAGK